MIIKVYAHLTDLTRVKCVIWQLTRPVRYDFIFLDFFFLKAHHNLKIFFTLYLPSREVPKWRSSKCASLAPNGAQVVLLGA